MSVSVNGLGIFCKKARSWRPISQNKTRITASFLVILGGMATSILLLRSNIKTPLPLLILVVLDLFHTELFSSKNVQSSNHQTLAMVHSVLPVTCQTATARHTELQFILSSHSPLICIVQLSFGMYIYFRSGVL